MPKTYLIPMYAAAVCAAAAAGAQVPAQATPSPDCDWTIQATGSTIDFSGHTAHVDWGLQNSGRARFDGDGPLWPLSGPVIIKGTNELDFTITTRNTIVNDVFIPAFTNSYGGSIDQGGTASGTWHNDQGGSGTWTMTKSFQCIANKPAAAAPPPSVEAPPPPPPAPEPVEAPPTDKVVMTITKAGLFNVNVNVTSSAPIAGHCTYNANEIGGILTRDEEFDIAANGKKTLTLAAPPLGQTWHVVLSCRGDFKGQNVEFGHQEQNFP